jgi:hypothetical protein
MHGAKKPDKTVSVEPVILAGVELGGAGARLNRHAV